MKKFFKLLLLTFTIFLTACSGGEDKGNYNQLDDHGKVGDKISDERFLDSDYAVVQFSADWCVWCRKQYPNLIEVSKEYDDVDFFLLDVEPEKGKSIKEKYDVRALPTTIYFENGKEVCRETGYQSSDDIIEEIEHLTSGYPKLMY